MSAEAANISPPGVMRNIRGVVEYDGTAFCGWQRQPEGRSVQGEMERVLRDLLQEEVNVIAAGRTDAGVHARGQVVNFRTQTRLECRKIQGGLNALLPEDIVVRATDEVPPEFHARFDAKERKYSYLIRSSPTALDRHVGYLCTYPLKYELLQQSAKIVLQQRNFEAFCKTGSDVNHYVCAVTRSEWLEGIGTLTYVIQADRFLRGMVRALVGTMIDIGRGAVSVEMLEPIFNGRNRSDAGTAAPPQGLILEQVLY